MRRSTRAIVGMVLIGLPGWFAASAGAEVVPLLVFGAGHSITSVVTVTARTRRVGA